MKTLSWGFLSVWHIPLLFHWRPPAEDLSPDKGGGVRGAEWLTSLVVVIIGLGFQRRRGSGWLLLYPSATTRGVKKIVTQLQLPTHSDSMSMRNTMYTNYKDGSFIQFAIFVLPGLLFPYKLFFKLVVKPNVRIADICKYFL